MRAPPDGLPWPTQPCPALLVERGNSTDQWRVPLVTTDLKACGEVELLYCQ